METSKIYKDLLERVGRSEGERGSKVYLRTFGCQMNVRDSQLLKGLLLQEGFSLTDREQDADVVIFNTCAVRKHAEDRVFSILGGIGKRKERIGRPRVIALVGCMAEEWKERAFEKAGYLNIVCGPNDLYRLPLAIRNAFFSPDRRIVLVGSPSREEDFYRKGNWFVEGESAFVIVMEGCNNFCSYCIVPYVRGRERSRPWQEVVSEVKKLVAQGVSKFTLLGQNVNSYQGGVDFPDLLEKVAMVEGVKSLSFATSHPKDATDRLFEVMARYPNIEKYLHLPLQSGSDRILKLMNRGYTFEDYRRKVDSYRQIVSGGKISTDLIVGFPTETEEDFQKTVEAVKSIGFDCAYIFKYSPRPFTKASMMGDDVPLEAKERRHQILLSLQKEISLQKKDKFGGCDFS